MTKSEIFPVIGAVIIIGLIVFFTVDFLNAKTYEGYGIITGKRMDIRTKTVDGIVTTNRYYYVEVKVDDELFEKSVSYYKYTNEYYAGLEVYVEWREGRLGDYVTKIEVKNEDV